MTGLVLQQLVNALTIGAIYALIALGYTMVYGVMRLINFVHGELFMLGAYISLGLLILAGHGMGGAGALLVAGVMLLVFLIVGGIGVTIERVAYKPLRSASRLAPMLSALGLSLALQAAVQLICGPAPITYPSVLPTRRIVFAGASLTLTQIGILVLALLLMGALQLFVGRSRLGVVVRAVSENARTAALLGINVDRAISLIFLLGPGLGALGGLLYASYYGVMTPTMGVVIGLKAFTAAIMGGIGSIPGAMLGGLLLGALEVLGTSLLPIVTHGYLGTEYRDIFAFTALIVVLLFRPSGLLGEQVSEETMVYKSDY
jgi:branched-chain amino acid transport system permease protein